jgi:hypothetical protein
MFDTHPAIPTLAREAVASALDTVQTGTALPASVFMSLVLDEAVATAGQRLHAVICDERGTAGLLAPFGAFERAVEPAVADALGLSRAAIAVLSRNGS